VTWKDYYSLLSIAPTMALFPPLLVKYPSHLAPVAEPQRRTDAGHRLDRRAVHPAVQQPVRLVQFRGDLPFESHAITGDPEGSTGLFISPGFRFRAIDAMVTNFHMPRSTVLAMVMALAGGEEILDAYRDALRHRYRFLSYGDAMLIL